MVLEDVAITGNHATEGGGGVYGIVVDLHLRDSRVTGNSAPRGGGIFNEEGAVFLDQQCQITGNTATGGAGSGGGVLNTQFGETFIYGAEVAGNSPDDCVPLDECHEDNGS
jgi:hypothetical protein